MRRGVRRYRRLATLSVDPDAACAACPPTAPDSIGQRAVGSPPGPACRHWSVVTTSGTTIMAVSFVIESRRGRMPPPTWRRATSKQDGRPCDRGPRRCRWARSGRDCRRGRERVRCPGLQIDGRRLAPPRRPPVRRGNRKQDGSAAGQRSRARRDRLRPARGRAVSELVVGPPAADTRCRPGRRRRWSRR